MDIASAIRFAKAYDSLGTAVQEQLDALLDNPRNAYDTDAVSTGAIDIIKERLIAGLRSDRALEDIVDKISLCVAKFELEVYAEVAER